MSNLGKSFFSSSATATAKTLNYPIYRRPQNHLSVSDFVEKFKKIQDDEKEKEKEKQTEVVLTGTK